MGNYSKRQRHANERWRLELALYYSMQVASEIEYNRYTILEIHAIVNAPLIEMRKIALIILLFDQFLWENESASRESIFFYIRARISCQ